MVEPVIQGAKPRDTAKGRVVAIKLPEQHRGPVKVEKHFMKYHSDISLLFQCNKCDGSDSQRYSCGRSRKLRGSVS